MDKDTIIDILSGILYLLPPKQTEHLAERLVYDCFSSEKLESFLNVILKEQVEFENDKREFEIRRLLFYSKKL